MAIVNRTPDSFYDRGATFAFDAAMQRVHDVVRDGADIVDIGGVKAAPGDEVDVAEEIERTRDFVAAVRTAYPDLPISVDTWRHEVGAAVCAAGATILNDSWGGPDPDLARVAAEYGAGLVCTHAGGVTPRTRPHRVEYEDVVDDVVRTVVSLAERAAALGVRADQIWIDAGHDFGKNTYHSLEVTRRLGELVATGWPVLVSVSNKDFVGKHSPDRLANGCSARSRRRRSARGRAPGCSAHTTSPRPGRSSTWPPRSRASIRRPGRYAGWPDGQSGRRHLGRISELTQGATQSFGGVVEV